jgi:iron-sulfur cluster assembly protein
MSIKVTDRARAQLLQLGAGSEAFLRISVVTGGCAGSTYSAALDHAMDSNDQLVYHQDQLRVVADSHSAMFLNGLEIDYSDDLIQSGFRFNNPMAAKACGCGSSFAAITSLGKVGGP